MSDSKEGDGSLPAVRVAAGSAHRTDANAVADAAREGAETSTVRRTGSTGVEALEPLLVVTTDDGTAFYAAPSHDRAGEIVSAAESGEFAENADAVVEGEEGTPDEDGTLPTPEEGPLSVGRRRALGRCGWVDPSEPPADSLLEAVREDPDDVREGLRKLGLLGRGRGDARSDRSIAEGWEEARDVEGDPVLVVNANDADERNRTDRTLLEGDAGGVVDAAMAVGHLLDAEDVVVYAEEESLGTERLSRAISRYREAHGEAPQLAVGPERFIAGEPTMALESLEGNDRLEARLTPPGPETHGLYGRPTVIHTPRTLLQVREAIRNPDGFDADDADPGTRLVTVTGDVDAPATVELSTGSSMRTATDAVDHDSVKMAVVGGQFGGFIRRLDHTYSAPALDGADLGSEGVIELFGEDRCALAAVGDRANFASQENCGRSGPCREGTKQMTDLLRQIYSGKYKDDMLRELTRTMQNSSMCHFEESAARTVETAMSAFDREFAAHAEGRCPSGECDGQSLH